MRCPNCHTINPPNAKFCLECGNRLIVCPNCGTVNLPFAKFCIECGTPLAGDTARSSTAENGSGHGQARPARDGNGNATEALPDPADEYDALHPSPNENGGGNRSLPAAHQYKRAETAFEGNRSARALNGRTLSGSDDAPQERRVVTIMFADITGSTPLADRLDPEDMRAIPSRYRSWTCR